MYLSVSPRALRYSRNCLMNLRSSFKACLRVGGKSSGRYVSVTIKSVGTKFAASSISSRLYAALRFSALRAAVVARDFAARICSGSQGAGGVQMVAHTREPARMTFFLFFIILHHIKDIALYFAVWRICAFPHIAAMCGISPAHRLLWYVVVRQSCSTAARFRAFYRSALMRSAHRLTPAAPACCSE